MQNFFLNEDGKKCDGKSILTLVFLLSAMFLLGRTVHFAVDSVSSSHIQNQADNWGLGGYGENGEKPTGNVSAEELKKYDTYYISEGEDKVIYLTFDAGYENGNTEPILDALKKHNVSATFLWWDIIWSRPLT